MAIESSRTKTSVWRRWVKDTMYAKSENIVMAAGKGIDFSANANSAGMTSELLDDYEDGTWTPTISGTGYAVGNGSTVGTYTKIGNVVNLLGKYTVGSTSTWGTNSMIMGGLPFVWGSDLGLQQGVILDSGTGYRPVLGYITNTDTNLTLFASLASSTYTGIAHITSIVPITWASSDVIAFNITYRTTDA